MSTLLGDGLIGRGTPLTPEGVGVSMWVASRGYKYGPLPVASRGWYGSGVRWERPYFVDRTLDLRFALYLIVHVLLVYCSLFVIVLCTYLLRLYWMYCNIWCTEFK